MSQHPRIMPGGAWNFTDPFQRWISMACLGVWRNTFSSHCGVASQIWAGWMWVGNLPWKCFTNVPPQKKKRDDGFFSISKNCIEKKTQFFRGHVVNFDSWKMWGTRSAIDFFLVLGTEVLTYNDRYKIMLDWFKEVFDARFRALTCLVLLYFFQLLLKVHPIAHLGSF